MQNVLGFQWLYKGLIASGSLVLLMSRVNSYVEVNS